MACVTPGCASTSRSKRRRPLSPRMSCRMRLPPSPLFMTPIGRPPRATRRRASWSGQRQKASIVEMLPSVSESPSATMPPASRRRQHIDAAQEEPLVGQIADRHHRLGGEIARRRDVVGLPRIAAGDREIRRHLARQIEADREIGERRHAELDRIAEQHRAGGDRRRRRCRRSSACGRSRRRSPGPCRAARYGRRRSSAAGCRRRSRCAPAACSPPRLMRGFIRSVWLLKPTTPSAGAGAAAQVPTHVCRSCIAALLCRSCRDRAAGARRRNGFDEWLAPHPGPLPARRGRGTVAAPAAARASRVRTLSRVRERSRDGSGCDRCCVHAIAHGVFERGERGVVAGAGAAGSCSAWVKYW